MKTYSPCWPCCTASVGTIRRLICSPEGASAYSSGLRTREQSWGGGPFDAASGFTVFSTGFSSAFGAASGLLSFSTAGGFSPGFGPFGGSAGAGCPVIRGFSLVSGATLPVSGAISAAFPAALASVERHRRL
jgi:hypothetical protein